jgi:hypothetical protein
MQQTGNTCGGSLSEAEPDRQMFSAEAAVVCSVRVVNVPPTIPSQPNKIIVIN